MQRRTVLMLSLVVSIISLLYLILGYYGWIRYYKLKHSPKLDTESYLQLDKADDKNRVVIAFTASEEQLQRLAPFLSSILDQTVRVDDIALTVPYKYIDKVPAELKKILTVYGYSKDYDDASNLICSVLREPESQTKIIMVDPSVLYGLDFIETIVDASKENKVIYGSKDESIQGGILIQPSFFNDKISKYTKGSGCCKWLKECCQTTSMCIDYTQNYKL